MAKRTYSTAYKCGACNSYYDSLSDLRARCGTPKDTCRNLKVGMFVHMSNSRLILEITALGPTFIHLKPNKDYITAVDPGARRQPLGYAINKFCDNMFRVVSKKDMSEVLNKRKRQYQAAKRLMERFNG